MIDYIQWLGIVVGVIAYITVYLTFYRYVVRRRRSQKEESKDKFFKALQEGLKSGSIMTIDDVACPPKRSPVVMLDWN